MRKDWRIHNLAADFNGLGQKLGVDPVVIRVMRNRGIIEDEDYRSFLYGTLADTHAPELMLDMELGADIISSGIDGGESIRIVGDYDVDGVTSTYVLYDAIKKLGGNVSYDIPHRIRDGYGINERIVMDAYNDGVSMIVTCDNGIAAVEAINKAVELGMTVVVTDHHEIPPELPNADAIINPHQEGDGYPFKDICGCEVAYKLIQTLYKFREEELDPRAYLEIVALATNCDVMPLVDENRIYVKEGLKELECTSNIGLRALINASELADKKLSTYHLGFVLGPCLNAAGKLEDAKEALELLLTEDPAFAEKRAMELKILNDERKNETEQGTNSAASSVKLEEIEGELQPVDKVIVEYLPGIHEGVAGVIAGRVRERYGRPTIIFTDTDGDPDILKGSGRSVEVYNMFEKIDEHRDLTVKFGGHPMAAGLSIKREVLDEFRTKLNEDAGLTYGELIPKLMIDVPMPMYYASMKLAEELGTLEPFGKQNEKPLFAEANMEIVGIRIFGNARKMLSLTVKDKQGRKFTVKSFEVDGFLEDIKRWFKTEECDKMMQGIETGCKIDIAYELSINEFRGERNLEFMMRAYNKA